MQFKTYLVGGNHVVMVSRNLTVCAYYVTVWAAIVAFRLYIAFMYMVKVKQNFFF